LFNLSAAKTLSHCNYNAAFANKIVIIIKQFYLIYSIGPNHIIVIYLYLISTN